MVGPALECSTGQDRPPSVALDVTGVMIFFLLSPALESHFTFARASQGRDIGLGHGHASVHTCAVIAPLTVYQHITGNDRQGSGVSDSEVEDIIDRLVSAPSRYDSRAPRHALIMCAHARAGPSHHARPAEEARADDAWHDRAG